MLPTANSAIQDDGRRIAASSIGIRDYHATPHDSSTTLRQFVRERTQYYFQRVLNSGKEDNYVKEFAVGSVAHALFLEDGAGIRPVDISTRSKEFAELRKTSQDVVVGRDAYDIGQAIYRSLMATSITQKFFPTPPVKSECSYFWQDEKTGLPLKVRFDILAPDFAADLKTSSDSRPPAFRRKFWELRYDIQAGLYLTAMQLLGLPLNFYYLTVATSPPYEVFVYLVDRREAEFHIQTVREILDHLAFCKSSKDHQVWYEPWESENVLSITPNYDQEPYNDYPE